MDDDKCYIISYDLRTPDGDYKDLYKAIKSYSGWAHINESVWAVTTSKTASEIRDRLFNHMNSDDSIFVIRSGKEAAWRNPICRKTWLKENL